MKYIVKWKDTKTNNTGKSKEPMSKDTAISWVDAMNRKYPWIMHWIEQEQ